MQHSRILATLGLAVCLAAPPFALGSVGTRAVVAATMTRIRLTCSPGETVHRVTSDMVSIEPPRGFNPLTASDAQLLCYALPPRPHDPQERRHWERFMRVAHYVVPRVNTASFSLPVARPQSTNPQTCPTNGNFNGIPLTYSGFKSYVWGGEVAYGDRNNNSYFTRVSANFNVFNMAAAPGAVVGAWVGLGGAGIDPCYLATGNTLWQVGVSEIADPLVQFFYEDAGCSNPCPNGGQPIYLGQPAIHIGDSVGAYADAQNGSYSVTDYTLNEYSGLSYVSIDNNNTGQSAEWIVEEAPCGTTNVNGDYQPCDLTAYSPVTFSGAQATGNGSTRNIDGWTLAAFAECNDFGSDPETVLTTPSGVSGSSHGFTQTYSPSSQPCSTY